MAKIKIESGKKPKEAPEVTVYTAASCKYCTAAKEYLAERKVAFREIDVSKDEAKAKEMAQKSSQGGVPVLEINGRIVVGFDRQLIDDALKRDKPPKREAFLQNLFYDPFSR